MKHILKLAALVGMGALVYGQGNAGYTPPLILVQNATTTGTTLNKFASYNSSGQALITSAGATQAVKGLVIDNPGTSGQAALAQVGIWPVVVDGTTTAGHYIQISAGTAGAGTDSGAATYPTTGGQVLGTVVVASTGAASTSMVSLLLGSESQPAAGAAVTIASGTSALGTSAISSAACATVVTTTATGAASTDTIGFTPNASIKAVTGYVPLTTGGLSITAYPTTNNVNFDVCNWSNGSITPGAVTLNWRIVR